MTNVPRFGNKQFPTSFSEGLPAKITSTCANIIVSLLDTNKHSYQTFYQYIYIGQIKKRRSILCPLEERARERERSIWLLPPLKSPFATIQSREPRRWRKEGRRKEAMREYRRRGKRIRRWRRCRPSWCEDKNWFIAALMRSGMPGEGGCSPSPRRSNIKWNRSPPLPLKFLQRSQQRLQLSEERCYPDSWSRHTISSPHVSVSQWHARVTAVGSAALTRSVNTNSITTLEWKTYCKHSQISIGWLIPWQKISKMYFWYFQNFNSKIWFCRHHIPLNSFFPPLNSTAELRGSNVLNMAMIMRCRQRWKRRKWHIMISFLSSLNNLPLLLRGISSGTDVFKD